MYLQRKAGVTICGRYYIVALFALVGRCVALQECGWVTVALRRFVGGFGPLFGAPKATAGESLWRFIAPLALTAARSADCHGGFRRFEIDADHAVANMFWRYFL